MLFVKILLQIAMASLARGVFVVAAKRTPIGTFGGLLKDFTATTLQELSATAALQAAKLSPELVDSVVFGNVIQSSTDAAYLARHVALRVGVPVPVPALTINRLCGSGFQSIINAAHEIQLGEADIVMCGGCENMTQSPFAIRDVRFGVKLGSEMKVEDTLWTGLTDMHIKTPMGMTAEALADQYNLTRADADDVALRSQSRWRAAEDAGRFQAEITPVTLKSKKGEQVMSCDEHPRPTTRESLAKLPPVFRKNGAVTAGNASGVGDGGATLIVVSEDALKKHNLTPLVEVVGYNVCGCDPNIMGIGPVPAIRGLLKKTDNKLEDIDLVEVNEAFAPQFLSVERELGLDPEKTNVDGGAIAVAHPLGMSGARISCHITHELRRRAGKLAIGSACIGGGQGIAVMFRNC